MKKVLSLIMVAVLAISFTACSSGSKQEKSGVKTTIEKSITALKKCDVKTLNKYVESETLDSVAESIELIDGGDKLVKAIFAPLEYDISEVNVKDSKATASVEFKTKDLKTVATTYMQGTIGAYFKGEVNFEDKAYVKSQIDKIKNMINDENVEEKTFNVIVNLEQKDGKWVVILDETVEDAIMGGAASTITSIITLAKSKAQ